MALKTLIQAEQIVHTLDPDLDISKGALADIQLFLTDQFSVETVKSQVQTQVMRSAKEIVRRIPDLQQATMQWLTQYEKGKFEVQVNTDELNARLDIFNQAAHRLSIGLLLLGMVIGSAFATNMEGDIFGIQLSTLAFMLFVFSLLVSLYMVLRMIREANQTPPRPPRIRY